MRNALTNAYYLIFVLTLYFPLNNCWFIQLEYRKSFAKKMDNRLAIFFLQKYRTDCLNRFYKDLKKACKDAKIGVRHFHDFRRTAVRNMVRF